MKWTIGARRILEVRRTMTILETDALGSKVSLTRLIFGEKDGSD